jgi:hypothetical protein
MSLETRLHTLEHRQPPRRIRLVWPLEDPHCPDVHNEPAEPGDVVVRIVYEETKGSHNALAE